MVDFDRRRPEKSSRRLPRRPPVFIAVDADDLQALPAAALRPPRGPRTVIVVLDDLADGVAIAAWCSHVRSLLVGGRADLVTCDVERLDGPAGVVLDALARLQLTARRSGGSIRLRHLPPTLEELLAAVGFGEVLPVCERLPIEGGRGVEEGEQLRVEEGVDPDDPTR